MNYYTLSEPKICKDVLNTYKEFNDPIRMFVEEVLPECVWDLLPFTFLYDLYKEWFRKNSPSGQPVSNITFKTDLLNAITDTEWVCKDKRALIRSDGKMDKPEPLILAYNLKDWMNSSYRGTDKNKICTPSVKDRYRGIVRS